MEEKKFFFPYEWFNDLSKLEYDHLPDFEAFYSELKEVNTLDQEYQLWLSQEQIGERPVTGEENYEMLKNVWSKEKMRTFEDFLKYYNILDVAPFVKAIDKLQELISIYLKLPFPFLAMQEKCSLNR